ncbi:MAG: Uncharacterized protein XD58_1530 [Thermotoga sp. 50_1627]|uniref:flagellar export chaperone FlgN n=1 Tax=Pseudothermotoga sp. TaxID=2033661 RepID=UPI00076C0423|nr:MAG: Uncharacterized protein XD45_1515 [Thermotoga sp. 50_64]KUK24481.1 MAG: Uncharacterized protein XD58_1530 [Thermotoga sp. 50_1627]MBC7115890.1 flagellar export chaperone FlgN [Pseudothermotoga sp.]MDK2923950.1 hypothetical protein [Pseudothermotoga sp.]HBT39693.1 hypothetical protein [Pseudothermotoga sp.]
MERLLSILEKEERVLLQIEDELARCERFLLKKDVSLIEEGLVRLEDLLEEFSRLENNRMDLFEALKRELGVSETTSFFDFCKQDSTLMERLFRLVDHLKDLSHRIERIRSLSEFHQAYFDFLKKLLNPPSLSTYDSKARLGSEERRSFKAES